MKSLIFTGSPPFSALFTTAPDDNVTTDETTAIKWRLRFFDLGFAVLILGLEKLKLCNAELYHNLDFSVSD